MGKLRIDDDDDEDPQPVPSEFYDLDPFLQAQQRSSLKTQANPRRKSLRRRNTPL